MNRTDSNIKFVGLHAHSVAGSLFDAVMHSHLPITAI